MTKYVHIMDRSHKTEEKTKWWVAIVDIAYDYVVSKRTGISKLKHIIHQLPEKTRNK